MACSVTLTDNHSLYVYNKIDSISLEHLDKLAREPHTAVMSCELDLGVTDVVDKSWDMLNLIRIYTKRFVWHETSPAVVSYANTSTGKESILISLRL